MLIVSLCLILRPLFFVYLPGWPSPFARLRQLTTKPMCLTPGQENDWTKQPQIIISLANTGAILACHGTIDAHDQGTRRAHVAEIMPTARMFAMRFLHHRIEVESRAIWIPRFILRQTIVHDGFRADGDRQTPDDANNGERREWRSQREGQTTSFLRHLSHESEFATEV